ncbi:MAG: creatininase family protein [Chloroflexi bacterium]|nr:creatininase family protein [Chloroflexota bacterium]
MQWEQLTGGEFEAAVEKAAGVCVIPIGVIEYHGPHLPLGTDSFTVHALACEAARREPVIVFPSYHFGVNTETKHFPGGIVVKDHLLFELLENVCDEISRNGLKKIVLLSGHGGNRFFLPLFVQLMLDKGKDYTLYFVRGVSAPEVHRQVMETEVHGHACECETSMALHLYPQFVKMEALDPESQWTPQNRLGELGERLYTPADWFSRFPEHCAGDPRPATAEKGKALFEALVAELAEILRAVKEDRSAPEVYAAFNERIYRR